MQTRYVCSINSSVQVATLRKHQKLGAPWTLCQLPVPLPAHVRFCLAKVWNKSIKSTNTNFCPFFTCLISCLACLNTKLDYLVPAVPVAVVYSSIKILVSIYLLPLLLCTGDGDQEFKLSLPQLPPRPRLQRSSHKDTFCRPAYKLKDDSVDQKL